MEVPVVVVEDWLEWMVWIEVVVDASLGTSMMMEDWEWDVVGIVGVGGWSKLPRSILDHFRGLKAGKQQA